MLYISLAYHASPTREPSSYQSAQRLHETPTRGLTHKIACKINKKIRANKIVSPLFSTKSHYSLSVFHLICCLFDKKSVHLYQNHKLFKNEEIIDNKYRLLPHDRNCEWSARSYNKTVSSSRQ